jgi:dihydrodipicolinate synthase/N-acetylneuraminate lyase
MVTNPLPRGLIVDLITPLLKNGDIDAKGLERHINNMMSHVQAIYVGGPGMGEGANLSPEQREELFHQTLLIVQSRLPVLTWISAPTDEGTETMLLSLRKRIGTLGYAGPVFWVDTPLYYHSNRGLEETYERMSSLVEEPFILVNDPEFVKTKEQPFKRINIRTSILKGLASKEKIKGLIFSGALERAYNYRKAVRSNPDFMIYDGDESQFLEHPNLNGILSRGANLAPAPWKIITSSSLNLNGDMEGYPDRMRQVMEAGRYLNDLKNIYERHDADFFKQALIKSGILEGEVQPDGSEDVIKDVEKITAMIEERRNYVPFKTRL